jgi:hypothetical protein
VSSLKKVDLKIRTCEPKIFGIKMNNLGKTGVGSHIVF